MTIWTLESIHGNCVEVGDCWEWAGAYGGTKKAHPYCYHDGSCTTVRSVVLKLSGKGRKSKKHCVAFPTCGNSRCVNPAHLRWATRSEVMYAAGAKGLLNDRVRVAKIAATKRATAGKLTMDAARAIRASDERQIDLAKRYGVSQHAISAIKMHRRWKEYDNNPFAGLGARS